MGFIELLTNIVLMESEKRARDREDWIRRREERQWHQNDTSWDGETEEKGGGGGRGGEGGGIGGGRGGGGGGIGRGGAEGGTYTQQRRPPPTPPKPRPPVPPRNDTRFRPVPEPPSQYPPELMTILQQMAKHMETIREQEEPTYSQLRESCIEGSTMPPSYRQHEDFVPVGPSSQTDLKKIISRGDGQCSTPREPTSPSSINSQTQDSISSTQLKAAFSRQPSYEGESLSSEEKAELLDTIRKLSEEQQVLKSKISEHDERLLSLITKKPSVRRRMSSRAHKMMLTPHLFSAEALNAAGAGPLNQTTQEEDNIYAQIENLYANLCRIHFPPQAQKTLHSCVTVNQTHNQFTTGPTELALHQEIKDLKEKISVLEDRLKEASKPTNQMATQPPLNNIESLKFELMGKKGSKSVFYANLPSTESNLTTDNNNTSTPCPYSALPKDVQQVASTFEWCISNYSEKFEMEKGGKIRNTISEPFYIGQCGYLARMEVYLNGNSDGKDKYMSVFLRIVKGDYDEFLTWPVVFPLTFKLINQEDKTMDGSLMFGNDQTIFTYQKPDDSWGLLKFVSHDTIKERKYIKDDTIKLRIDIDRG